MVAPPPPNPSSAAPSSLMAPGTRLGRYLIVGELGTGGMATVYEGKALSVGGFSRRVAIKYLHPHLLRDEQFVQMFLDEGRLAAQIHHPNVVAVLDLVSEPDQMYMVSEFVEGDQLLSLARAVREAQARIPPPIALRLMLDALAGLHAAHELTDDVGTALRIVHRDVSPHNILVGVDGITRIVDFGIAKAEERIATTRDGIVKGKLSYMAPEQPDDLPVDRRADIFSAATVLWESLTGQRLFPGRTDREVLQALLHKPIPRLRDVAPELPQALDDVLARGLARDPDQRFMLASEFALALEDAAGEGGVATARDVAAFVERHASRKLSAERERRRRMTTKDLPAYRDPTAVRSVSPAAVRTEPGLGPDAAQKGTPEDAPTTLSAPHAIQRIMGGPEEPEPLTRVKTPVPRAATSAPPVGHSVAPLALPASSRAAYLLPFAVVALGVILGYGVWWLLQPAPAPPRARAPSVLTERAPVAAPTRPPATTPPVVTPPPIAVAAPAHGTAVAAPPTAPTAPTATRPTPTGHRAPSPPRPRPVASPDATTHASPPGPAPAPPPSPTGFELPRGI